LAAASGLTDPLRTRRLGTWFDAVNRARSLLRTTVRSDLAVVELLLAWRDDVSERHVGGIRR
jgi:DNA polymerase-3 subunit delta'